MAPGGNAPRSREPDETSRLTDEGGFGDAGFGAEPISVGRCDNELDDGWPHAGQKWAEPGTSASQ